MMHNVALVLLTVIGAPIAGGLLMGIDRRLTARLQSRIGPPITQPFYDVIKLFGKSRMACNRIQRVCVSLFVATMALSLVMLVLGQDLLVMLFILALGMVSLVIGGFSVRSPYSQLGSQREILQMLAYEPLLVFMVVAIYLKTGSFLAAGVFRLKEPLLYAMPVFLVTQSVVLAIKLHKSPFDLSGSHHAHQELVRGIYTEFSGSHLGMIEIGHWYELVLLLGFIALLFHTVLAIGILIALACLFAVILLDNVSARLTWGWMLRFAWTAGIGLSVANLAFIYLTGPVALR